MNYRIEKNYRDNDQFRNSFGNSVNKVVFAFVPQDTRFIKQYEYKEDDTTFFVRGDNLMQDMGTILSFPEIVHA